MAGSSNGNGPRPKPGAVSPRLSIPTEFCIFCCQLMKGGKQDNIKPMLTRTVIFVNAMPVAVPTCMDHLEAPSTRSLIT